MDERIYVVGSVSFGWLHGRMGVQLDEAYFFDPAVHQERYLAMCRYVEEEFPDYEIYCHEGNLVQVEYWEPDQVLVGGIQPNLILGAAVGARFAFFGDKDPDISPAPLGDLQDVGALREIEWEERFPIDRFLEQIDRLTVAGQGRGKVIPPFFWDASGMAVLHGPLTTAQKLMGERIYTECVDRPAFVREFLDWIAESYVRLARLFASRAGLEITSVHIGECSACLVGDRQLREFSLPACEKIADGLGAVRYHTCGRSDHLLEGIASLSDLSAINTGSNTSVARMREVFGPEFRIEVAPDAQLLSFGTPDEVRRWVDRCLEENQGGPLTFVYHLDVGYPVENVLAIHDVLIERGYVRPGRHREGIRLKGGG